MQNCKKIFESEFEKYISNFDTENLRIKLKIIHMYKVEEIAKQIAIMLYLPKKDIELSEFLGLYHDIGRFEQVKQYETFFDEKSIDHASFGANLLRKNDFIKKVYPGLKDDEYEVLLCAISYHNKFILTEDMPYFDHYLCKIIRDADKIDIYRSMADSKFKDLFFNLEEKDTVISNEIKQAFYSKQPIPKSIIKTQAENLVMKIAFVFDFNYSISKEILIRYGHFEKFVETFLSAKTVKNTMVATTLMEMYDFANDFLHSI